MANLDTKVLDILFRRISPNRIFQRLQREDSWIDTDEDYRLFLQFSGINLSEYSLDEHRVIYQRLQSEACALAAQENRSFPDFQRSASERGPLSLPTLAIYSILISANRMLKQRVQEPLCRIEQVIPWRETYLLLGQDLFVCAFLAHEDLRDRLMRRDFSWPAIIHTDHAGLNALLSRGLAENHQHLYGSSQTFALSWCNLMNYPDSHEVVDAKFKQLYQPYIAMGTEERFLSSVERVRYACLCRKHLHTWLHDQGIPAAHRDRRDCADAVYHCHGNTNAHTWEWLHELYSEMRLSNELCTLRETFGAKVPQPGGGTACLDYALEERVFQAAPDGHYRALAGERYFLYLCFRAFFENRMDERTKLAFYLYIVLKALFRSELIQVNKLVGFQNFSLYQDRKELLCNRDCYMAELIRMAVNAPLAEGHVSSLETRLSPCSTPRDYREYVSKADEHQRFADRPTDDLSLFDLPHEETVEREFLDSAPFFYVIHFIKKPDIDPRKLPDFSLICRHNKVRQTVRTQAIALSKALYNDAYLRSRIRGIDCASSEIGCPPEVFATAFRYLRKHRDYDTATNLLLQHGVPRLSATYHAGEDFLDIAGALRAIDEAVTYLEFERGDRIGHALGLGIEPEIHYNLKGYRIFLPKQDRLDDLTWLLYRSRELGVRMDPHLYGRLKKEAEVLLLNIYGKAMEENGWHIGLTEYHCCMKLRADEPALYKYLMSEVPPTARHEGICQISDSYDTYKYSTHDPALAQYRSSEFLSGMCHYYHYEKREKITGSEICEVEIDEDYINLIRKAQNALQDELARKGIIIECNPSSNVLIGTFGKYSKHPIFRFNNTGLELSYDRHMQCSQLQVCVNTDDLGVFDTSQEFEYALLFHALREMTDSDNHRCYKEAEILDYLENLRCMGLLAVFPPSALSETQEEGGGWS